MLAKNSKEKKVKLVKFIEGGEDYYVTPIQARPIERLLKSEDEDERARGLTLLKRTSIKKFDEPSPGRVAERDEEENPAAARQGMASTLG